MQTDGVFASEMIADGFWSKKTNFKRKIGFHLFEIKIIKKSLLKKKNYVGRQTVLYLHQTVFYTHEMFLCENLQAALLLLHLSKYHHNFRLYLWKEANIEHTSPGMILNLLFYLYL